MSTRKQANMNAIDNSIDSHDFTEKEMFEIEQNEYLNNYCETDDDFDYEWDGEDFIPF